MSVSSRAERLLWAKKGQRPHASSWRKYQWVYDYAFVHPNSGEMVHYVCSTVDTDLMSAVLAAFANDIGVGAHRQVILVLDRALGHRKTPHCPCGHPPRLPSSLFARAWPTAHMRRRTTSKNASTSGFRLFTRIRSLKQTHAVPLVACRCIACGIQAGFMTISYHFLPST